MRFFTALLRGMRNGSEQDSSGEFETSKANRNQQQGGAARNAKAEYDDSQGKLYEEPESSGKQCAGDVITQPE